MPSRDTSRSPPIDDSAVYDAIARRYAFPTLAMSVEVGLYEHLANQPRAIPEIADELQLSHRAAEALVTVVTAMGFLEVGEDGRFRPTPVARTYLLPDSPFYRRDLAHSMSSEVETLRLAIKSGDEHLGRLPSTSVQCRITMYRPSSKSCMR